MKIWCVDHAGLSWNIRSDLYFTKEEAQAAYDKYDIDGFYRKMYMVEDIWGWCARNFRRVVNEIVALRDSGDNFHYIYGLVEELRETAAHCGVEQFSADLVWGDVSWETEWDTCFMSVAWYHDGKLEHMNFLLNGIDHPWKYPALYKRGWEYVS